MEYFDFELVPLDEAQEIPVEWDFERSDDEFEALDELSVTLAVADLLEEVLGL